MQGLIQLSGHPLVHALGWTLLHFCWQGAAVALVLWCVLGLLGGRSSQARYGVACLALGLMLALPAATFVHVASAEYKARTAMLGSGVALDANLVLQVDADGPAPPWPARIGMALDRTLPWVLLTWFAGVIVFAGRLNFGLLVARRLKTAGTEAPPPALLRLFDDLRIRLGVARAVALLHSAQVQVPTVIGWLRPVVLLPASCLTGLSPEQIEAVLCHELAHVRRHDYLVSVIQSVIETILFYHPAVWWVSRQVRRERECCCDELAVAVGGDVLAYARALSFLEESRASFPEFVLGANGGVLKMRIKRILGSKRDAEGSPAGALVALGMIIAIAGSYFVVASRAQAQAREQATHTQVAEAAVPAGIVSVSQEGTANPDGSAVQSLHGTYKTWLEQDVRWIISGPEAQAFRQLANDEERDRFIEQFWARRDPPGAAAGTFREENYRRIEFANENFAADKPGWTTDRGHIYILYGQPDAVVVHPKGAVGGYPFQTWHYNYLPGIGDNVNLDFVDTGGRGDYHYTIDGASSDNMQARATLASRLLAPGGAGVPQSSAPPPASSAAQEAGSISGVVVDPTGALVARANVKTVNTDTGMTMAKVTDNTGSYSFSLPPGTYNVEVEARGFQQLLQENVHVNAGQTVGLNLRLTVGAASESLTVTGKQVAAMPPPPPPPVASGVEMPSGPLRISSGTMAGMAISQPAPVYPDEAKSQRVQGVVVLRARIAKDGTVKDLQVVSGPPPLIVSAIDAVRQWKYKPYLLNGEPTDVETTININYTFGEAADTEGQAEGAPSQSSPGVPNALRVSPGAMEGNLIAKVTPIYPEIAKAAHLQGVVVLHAIISKTGDVENLSVISGPPMLTSSAVDAVRQWRYKPYLLNGEPTEVETTINVNYTFEASAAAAAPNIRSIDYKGLSSVTIQEIEERMNRDGVGLSPETPYDVARVDRAAAVLRQLLAEHGHPNAIVSVTTQSIPPGAIAIQFDVKEGPKGAASNPSATPEAEAATPVQSAPQEYGGVPVRRIGDGVSAPELTYRVAPEFTEQARKAKFMGIVLVSLIVDPDGKPQNVHVLRGVGMGLDQKAVAAVGKYKFKPAMLDGKPVPVALNVEVNFQIF